MEKEKKKYPEGQRKYNREYSKRMIKMYSVLLNRNTNKDMIEYLDSMEHKQDYFKNLIRKDMESVNGKN